jgi:hypothetical protein
LYLHPEIFPRCYALTYNTLCPTDKMYFDNTLLHYLIRYAEICLWGIKCCSKDDK